MNLITLEELELYSSCPLKFNYASKEPYVKRPEDILTQAIRVGVSSLFLGMSAGTPRGTVINNSADAYRRIFKQREKEISKLGHGSFDIFNHGLVVLDSVVKLVPPSQTEFLLGSIPGSMEANVVVEDTTVMADLTGMVRIWSPETKKKIAIVVVLGTPSKEPSPRDYLLHGFWHSFMSDTIAAIDDDGGKAIMYVDIETAQSYILRIDPTAKAYFRNIALSCLRGIRNQVWLAWPENKKCAICPYRQTCSFKDCNDN